jgi:phytoene dehydrogenase-like protein
MVSEFKDKEVSVGKLSFTETIIVAKQKPADFGIKDTIIFFNEREDYQYRRPNEYYDPKSAVICFPNNYQHDDFDEGWFRLTHMANYPQWKQMPKEQYLEHKQFVKDNALRQLRTFMPTDKLDVLCEDIFSPTTIERYTSHFSGTVYGSEDKLRDGRTPIKGLAIIGTDQGFLGIVGACLSGISMANLHGLMEGQQ